MTTHRHLCPRQSVTLAPHPLEASGLVQWRRLASHSLPRACPLYRLALSLSLSLSLSSACLSSRALSLASSSPSRPSSLSRLSCAPLASSRLRLSRLHYALILLTSQHQIATLMLTVWARELKRVGAARATKLAMAPIARSGNGFGATETFKLRGVGRCCAFV